MWSLTDEQTRKSEIPHENGVFSYESVSSKNRNLVAFNSFSPVFGSKSPIFSFANIPSLLRSFEDTIRRQRLTQKSFMTAKEVQNSLFLS
jgi:hypothetical protein